MVPVDSNGPRLDKGSGWPEYQRFVIAELERLARENAVLRDDLSEARIAIALLQLKSGAWGAIAGAVVAVGAVLMKFVG